MQQAYRISSRETARTRGGTVSGLLRRFLLSCLLLPLMLFLGATAQTPTTFTVIPDSGDSFTYQGMVEETLTILLSDPEGDWEVPDIDMSLIDTWDLTYDSISGARIQDFQPDSAPVVGRTELADSLIFLIMRQDSILLTTTARTGKYNPIQRHYWEEHAFRTAYRWDFGYEIIISQERVFKIFNNDSSTATVIHERYSPAPSVSVTATVAGLKITAADDPVAGVRIYNPRGQLLLEVQTDLTAGIIQIPLNRTSSGILLVELLFADGTADRKTIHMMR